MPDFTQELSKHSDVDPNYGANESRNDDLNLLALIKPGNAASAAVAGGICIENEDDRSIEPMHMLPGLEIAKNIAEDPAIQHGFKELLKMPGDNTETGIKAGRDVLKGMGDAHKQQGESVGNALLDLEKIGSGHLGRAKLDEFAAAALKLRNSELKAEEKLLEGGMKAQKRIEERLLKLVDGAVEGKQLLDQKAKDGIIGAAKAEQQAVDAGIVVLTDAVKLKQDVDRKTVDLAVDAVKLKQDVDRKTVDLAVDAAKSAKPIVETGWQVYKKANPVIGFLGRIKDAVEK